MCISCDREVRLRQHAILCDLCERWQHRLCGTGITLQAYNKAKHGYALQFICRPCKQRNWRAEEPAEPEVKQQVTDNLQVRAMDIVTTVITRDIPVQQRFLAPKQKQVNRTANKHRSANRPADPDNLDFELDVDYRKCADFLVADLRVEGNLN
ncbi:unnamed protein product [Mytilus coruscus]|uniref:PHD-type domain-containing protein n=1 Tax=Mytilus coruscus TaxID=42192 RepID=A0A6J8CLR8_MYTCO|nr:unnamed protein product [Mytilus coruscus]